MTNQILLFIIYIACVILLSILITLIPPDIMGILTKPFSLKTFGIRKIKRWKSRTDTLANLFLWISALFSICYALIPNAAVFYALMITLTWLCTISRAIRLNRIKNTRDRQLVIFMFNLIYGFGLLSGIGYLNNFRLWNNGVQFFADLNSETAFHLTYYFDHVCFPSWLLQALVMMIPLMIMWGQFKYMRLENTFKAATITLFTIRSTIWVLIIVVLGAFGFNLLELIYQHQAPFEVASSIFEQPADSVALNPDYFGRVYHWLLSRLPF